MEQTSYVPVYQNKAINMLAFLIPGMKTVDWWSHLDSDGQITFTRDEILYRIDIRDKTLSVRTHQFLMYIISKYTSNVRQASSDKWIDKHLKMKVPFEDVAKEFNMSLHAVKPMVVQAVDFLHDLSIFAYWQRGRNKVFRKAHAVASYEVEINPVTRKGFITIELDNIFAKFLSFMSVMQYPKTLWKIPPKSHTIAYQFGYLMIMKAKMNIGKRNFNRISVSEFLDCTNNIPRKMDLGPAKQYRQRIIVPFVREFNVLLAYKVLADWQFVHSGKVISYNEIKVMDYDSFVKGIIVFTLSGNPEKLYLKQTVRKAVSPIKGHYISQHSDDEYSDDYVC